MSFIPPKLTELRDQFISRIESKTGDGAPVYEKAFYSILANVISLATYPVYKFVSWNYRQAFVKTCDEEHLENYHGLDEGVSRTYATKTEFDVQLTVSSPVLISVATTFENEATGLFYFPKQEKSVTVADNDITLIADGYGSEYSVSAGDELKISGSGISGVSSLCTVSSISVYAQDKQPLEEYRKDVLLSKSGSTGGCTASDHRRWSQSVTGVKRTFVFAGRPYDALDSQPGDRSIFVESDDELEEDGLATTDLIENVRTAIITDPDTGLERGSLGLTGSTLFVESVQHVGFTVYINKLIVDASVETELKESIETSIDEYLRNLCPYVAGVDAEYERNDNVSSVSISSNLDKIIKQFSAYASSIEVYEDGVGLIENRVLIGGDLARLTAVTYVD